ncbi:MAG: hypothetical protein H0U45_11655 [Tatlockia sp.]|jgi:hypothetical protein|nr:hypothetical protein [Tatlockia sp.]
MAHEGFEDLADEAIHLTKKGMELLTEVHRLQQLAKQLPKIEAYTELITEIVEKERLATNSIKRATLIERKLINKQRDEIEDLLNNL